MPIRTALATLGGKLKDGWTRLSVDELQKRKLAIESIQSLVVSTALVIGGLWALYAFDAQRKKENAEAALSKIKAETRAEPIITTSLQAVHIKDPDYGDLIHVVATLLNVSSKPVEIELSQTPESSPVMAVRMIIDEGRLKHEPLDEFDFSARIWGT